MKDQVLNIEKINWRQIWSLAALNAAVVISWIAYHNYQPRLLDKFHFTALAGFVAVAQAFILVFIPPLAGKIGDYFIKKGGNRFIVFTLGISITAMIFMVVAFTISDFALLSLRPFLPLMIVFWLVFMNVFHSPANSMLELFAPVKQIPTAMAVLALITDLLFALEPVIVSLVDFLGAPLTFVTGGILLILTGSYFRKTTGEIQLNRTTEKEAEADKDNYLLVVLSGLIFGTATAVIMNILPGVFEKVMKGNISGNLMACLLMGASAILAFPASRLIEQKGLNMALWAGFLIFSISFLLAFFLEGGIPGILALAGMAIAFSLISVAAFPFALKNLSPANVTFGSGIFFGCTEVMNGLMNLAGF